MRSTKGVTLIELMVTLAVLAIVAAIAIPAYKGYISTSRKTECQNEMASIKLAESEYFLDNNSYFQGTGVAALKTASGSIYVPSSAAAGSNSECSYDVSATASTYLITATPTTTGHLSGEPAMTFSGP